MTVRHLGPETMRRLQALADEWQVSKAYAARRVLQDYLLSLPPELPFVTWSYEITRPGFDLVLPEREVGELRDPFEDEG